MQHNNVSDRLNSKIDKGLLYTHVSIEILNAFVRSLKNSKQPVMSAIITIAPIINTNKVMRSKCIMSISLMMSMDIWLLFSKGGCICRTSLPVGKPTLAHNFVCYISG